MASFTLTDLASDTWLDVFDLAAADLGQGSGPAWSVSKRTLRGGRRDGVDLVRVDNGRVALAIAPTRGMGIWRATDRGAELGWKSPVVDGPVHPALVNLADRGGLGWLDGFDEFMVRCGLGHNGAPYATEAPASGGSAARSTIHGLHGRIANIPAHHVSVHVADEPPHAITVEGRVAESTVFMAQLELTTRITTVPGSNRVVVHDSVSNLSDRPGSMQLLYHWNFGGPYLGEGSTWAAPIDILVPRDPRAAEDLDRRADYGPPEPGFAEQAYLCHLLGQGAEGQTLAMLRSPGKDRAAVLRFRRSELPCFTLWKCTGGPRDGYVTGLEPATNFPHPRPFEERRGRVVPLPPGATFTAETTLEVLDSPEEVAAVSREIEAIQARKPPTIHPMPVEPFAPQAT